jgi:hypothetical protein
MQHHLARTFSCGLVAFEKQRLGLFKILIAIKCDLQVARRLVADLSHIAGKARLQRHSIGVYLDVDDESLFGYLDTGKVLDPLESK